MSQPHPHEEQGRAQRDPAAEDRVAQVARPASSVASREKIAPRPAQITSTTARPTSNRAPRCQIGPDASNPPRTRSSSSPAVNPNHVPPTVKAVSSESGAIGSLGRARAAFCAHCAGICQWDCMAKATAGRATSSSEARKDVPICCASPHADTRRHTRSAHAMNAPSVSAPNAHPASTSVGKWTPRARRDTPISVARSSAIAQAQRRRISAAMMPQTPTAFCAWADGSPNDVSAVSART